MSGSPVPPIETGTVTVDGVSTFFRRVQGVGPPTVFVHGNPTHSEDWQPFLERIRGPALAFDLPGWGRSARPSPAEFDYSMDGLARFTNRLLQRMAGRFGAAYAARLPNSELVELADAGHWPWIDAPEVVDRVIRFLATDEDFPNW